MSLRGGSARGSIPLAFALLTFLALLFACGSGRVYPPLPSTSTFGDASLPERIALEAGPGDAGNANAPSPDARFAALDALVAEAVAAGRMPGCVLVVGRRDGILLRRAYGWRAVQPSLLPMLPDTVFDLASLTKAVATSTSVMILVERGQIDLRAPASKYVPELAKLPPFTVEQLLVHTSGLPAATPVSDYVLSDGRDRAAVMRKLGELTTMKGKPGEKFLYTDVGFVILEEIVRRQSGRDLATFTHDEIFVPLGMNETGFNPPARLRERAAVTEQREGRWMIGEVHDPRAYALGGVAGHAGLFTTADDLSRFARAMLGRGALSGGARIMSEKTFDLMTSRHETTSGGRGLGWDRDSRFATHRSPRLSPKAFGHGGYTGTVMWIDPGSDLFVVFLSNRVHPDGKGAVNPLVADIVTHAIDALGTRTGIDVLRAEGFARLRGANVGLVTNASAKAKDGTSTIDVLRSAPGVTLRAIFSPEHGLEASREGKVKDGTFGGVPVYSLYGDRHAPSGSTLAGIDTLVFDLQDAGVRFYTYASTMKLAMKAAAAEKLRFVVLDRPNPIGGAIVGGPMLDAKRAGGLVHGHPLPIRHGMTMGELARLFAADEHLEVRLDVVTMTGWRRADYFDQTGLTWSPPSPNLRTVEEVVLYPMLGIVEGTNLSVGRGTESPFEVVGAPYIDGSALATKLATFGIAGLAFEPTKFTPSAGSLHGGKECSGLRFRVTDRARFDPMRAAMALVLAMRDVPGWDFEHVDRLLVDAPSMNALRTATTPEPVMRTWSLALDEFTKKRAMFLLYPEPPEISPSAR